MSWAENNLQTHIFLPFIGTLSCRHIYSEVAFSSSKSPLKTNFNSLPVISNSSNPFHIVGISQI